MAVQRLFPYKLYHLLETLGVSSTDDEQAATCITWLSHGRAFIIRDESVFISKVVPAHFKQTKLRSFKRQVLLWGFTRIQDGPDKGAWYHPHFIRGQPSLLVHVKRTAVKKNSTDAGLVEVEASPNFYEMPPVDVNAGKAMEDVGVQYSLPSNGYHFPTTADNPSARDGHNDLRTAFESALDADKEKSKGFANATMSNNLPMMAFPMATSYNDQAIAYEYRYPSWFQPIPNPALAVPWTNSSYVPECPIQSFGQGQMGEMQTQNLHAPLKNEAEGFNEYDNRDLKLQPPAVVSRFVMSNSNLNDNGLNASSEANDDLVTKAFQYAFRDMPARQVFCPEQFDSSPLMTQGNKMTSVHQDANTNGGYYSFGAKPHQDVALTPSHRTLRKDSSFTTDVSSSSLNDHFEENDEFLQFVNDNLFD